MQNCSPVETLGVSIMALGPAALVTTSPQPPQARSTCDTLGSVDRRAAVGLAPSRNNSAAMQQEFHSYFVSASTSRHKARVQTVLRAHSLLLWVDFQAVSLLMVC